MIDTTPYIHHTKRALSHLTDDEKSRLLKARIESNPRLRTVGGKCFYNTASHAIWIELNPNMLSKVSQEEQYETVSHEIAHALIFSYGNTQEGHGPLWQRIHKRMGGSASRTHNNPVPKNIKRRYIFFKDGATYSVTSQNYNKIKGRLQAGVQFAGVVKVDVNKMSYQWESWTDVAYLTNPFNGKLKLGT